MTKRVMVHPFDLDFNQQEQHRVQTYKLPKGKSKNKSNVPTATIREVLDAVRHHIKLTFAQWENLRGQFDQETLDSKITFSDFLVLLQRESFFRDTLAEAQIYRQSMKRLYYDDAKQLITQADLMKMNQRKNSDQEEIDQNCKEHSGSFSYLIKKQIVFEIGGDLHILAVFDNNTVQLFDFKSGEFRFEFNFFDFLQNFGDDAKNAFLIQEEKKEKAKHKLSQSFEAREVEDLSIQKSQYDCSQPTEVNESQQFMKRPTVSSKIRGLPVSFAEQKNSNLLSIDKKNQTLERLKNSSFQSIGQFTHDSQKSVTHFDQTLSIAKRGSVGDVSRASIKRKTSIMQILPKNSSKRVNQQKTMTSFDETRVLEQIIEEKSKLNATGTIGLGSAGHFIDTNKSISDIAGSAYNDESINLPFNLPHTTKHKNHSIKIRGRIQKGEKSITMSIKDNNTESFYGNTNQRRKISNNFRGIAMKMNNEENLPSPIKIREIKDQYTRAKMMMEVRRKFQDQRKLYGVKSVEEEKEKKYGNLGLVSIFEDMFQGQQEQDLESSGERKNTKQRAKTSDNNKKQATFEDSKNCIKKMQIHFRKRVKEPFGLDDRIFEYLQEDNHCSNKQKQEDLGKNLNDFQRLWEEQEKQNKLLREDIRMRQRKKEQLKIHWRQKQMELKNKIDVYKRRDSQNIIPQQLDKLENQLRKAEEEYNYSIEELDRNKKVFGLLADCVAADFNYSIKQSEASKSKQIVHEQQSQKNQPLKRGETKTKHEMLEINSKEDTALTYEIEEAQRMAKAEEIMKEIEIQNKICWDRISQTKNGQMREGASSCNKYQLLNLVFDKINPKEITNHKMQQISLHLQQEKAKQAQEIVPFDFNSFEPKPEEKAKLQSFYRTVFPDCDVQMKQFDWGNSKKEINKVEDKDKKASKLKEKAGTRITYPTCMSYYNFKDHVVSNSSCTLNGPCKKEDHYKEENLVVFALMTKEVIVEKIKQSGQKKVFLPIAIHRLDGIPLLMDVSHHKVKKNLIVCLAVSSKDIDPKTHSSEFSVIVLEFIKKNEQKEQNYQSIDDNVQGKKQKLQDTQNYEVQILFQQRSPFPQITSILYRPQCGLIMSCFRGYIEIFDSIKFDSRFQWDNNVKKNVIQKTNRLKVHQSDAQKLNVLEKMDKIYVEEFGSNWTNRIVEKSGVRSVIKNQSQAKDQSKLLSKESISQSQIRSNTNLNVQNAKNKNKKSVITIDCLDFSAALDLLAFSGVQGKVGVIDTTTMNFQDLYDTNTKEITSLYFYDKELQLLTLSLEGEVSIWDAQKMVILQTVKNKKILKANVSASSFYAVQGILLLATTKIFMLQMRECAEARIQIEQSQTVAKDFLGQYQKHLLGTGVIHAEKHLPISVSINEQDNVYSLQSPNSTNSKFQTINSGFAGEQTSQKTATSPSSPAVRGISLEVQHQLIADIFQANNLAQNLDIQDEQNLSRKKKKSMEGKVLSYQESKLVGCYFIPEKCQIFTVDIDCLIRIWCLRKGVCIRSYPLELPKSKDSVDEEFKNRLKIQRAALSKCHKILAVSFEGGLIQLNNIYSGAILYNKNSANAIDLELEVADLQFFNSQANFWVAAACWGGQVAFLSRPHGAGSIHENISFMKTESGHLRDVMTVDTTTSNLIVSGSIDNLICFWNYNGSKQKEFQIPRSFFEITRTTSRQTLKIGGQENYIQQLKFANEDSHEFILVFMSMGDVFVFEYANDTFIDPEQNQLHGIDKKEEKHVMAFAKVPQNSCIDRKLDKTQAVINRQLQVGKAKSGDSTKISLVLSVSETGEGTIHILKLLTTASGLKKTIQMIKLHSFWVESRTKRVPENNNNNSSIPCRLVQSSAVFNVYIQPEYDLFIVAQIDGGVSIFNIQKCQKLAKLNETYPTWDKLLFKNLHNKYKEEYKYEMPETYSFEKTKPPIIKKGHKQLNMSLNFDHNKQSKNSFCRNFERKKTSIQTEMQGPIDSNYLSSPVDTSYNKAFYDIKKQHRLLGATNNARNIPIAFNSLGTGVLTSAATRDHNQNEVTQNYDLDQTIVSSITGAQTSVFSSNRK